ncbi:hypothetical protein DITRI_Ditri01bG0138000 [Diplodiscus trichospermus]
MASFKVFFCLFLHALFWFSSSGTRLFNPFSISDQALMEEAKGQNKDNADKLEIIDRHFESMQFSGIGKLALAVEAKEHPKSSTETHEASGTAHESKQFPSSTISALVEKAREGIKASIQRNGGNLLLSLMDRCMCYLVKILGLKVANYLKKKRNDGNPFESKRVSPGGPDPHHH